jgi:hypothetical protein
MIASIKYIELSEDLTLLGLKRLRWQSTRLLTELLPVRAVQGEQQKRLQQQTLLL